MRLVDRQRSRRGSAQSALLVAMVALALATTGSVRAQSCVPTPPGTSFWAPLDENAGASLHNIAKPTGAGFDVGNPQIYSGYVSPGQARRYNGSSQYSEFPDHPWLNPWENGGAGFSLSCWVNCLTIDNVSGVRVILDKRTFVGGAIRGFTLFLDGGYLGCQIADGTYSNYVAYIPSHQIVPSNQWRFIAMSVNRPLGQGYLRVDNAVWNFNPSAHQGSLVTNAPLRIGASSDAIPGSHFSGIVDELMLSQKWLPSSTFDPVYTATPFGVAGMCKTQVAIFSAPSFPTLAQSCAWVQGRIWNNNVWPMTYAYSFQSLAANSVPGCTINGPTSIQPASGNITVLPFSFADVGALINRPLGLGYACVRLQASSGGNSVSHTASFWVNNGTLTAGPPCVYIPSPIVNAGVNQIGTASLTLGNDGPSPVAATYRLAVVAPDGTEDFEHVSLNGLPPGTAHLESVMLSPGTSQAIPVSATFVKTDPMRDYAITLLADAGGTPGGQFQTIAWVGLRDARADGVCSEALTPEAGSLHFGVSGAPAGATVYTFLTFAPGAFPFGWFFGLDIGFPDLVNQYNLAVLGLPPFAVQAGANGTADWSLAGLPPGIPVFGVSVTTGAGSVPLLHSNPFQFTTQ